VRKPRGTGDRMVNAENAALGLADAVEELISEMAEIAPADASQRTERTAQVRRARELARAVRAVVRKARRDTPGSMTS
jgi:hypothetical protein